MYPEHLRYTREHEWARIENGRVRVGITQFAAERLSDVVFIELPAPGSTVKQLQPFGVIESVKAVSDLYAPVSGTVAEVNPVLAERPELINQDPYGDGWMLVVELSNPAELQGLMSADEYRRLIGDGERRRRASGAGSGAAPSADTPRSARPLRALHPPPAPSDAELLRELGE